MIDRRAVLVLVLVASARAQTALPNTAHPAPFRPATDPFVRDAARSDLFSSAGRAWHLEAHAALARRPAPRCRVCDHPVIDANADLCRACAGRWRAIAARRWDL